ncbi:MAG: DUF805 domain-containing protein [Bacteroidetes bacterium]|nr:DUF805 domain-containing protein [Bacteroidota bacterium]
MFTNPFSFDGRIRRTEYGISLIIYAIAYAIVAGIVASTGSDDGAGIVFIFLIPILWFLWAQGAKRCHDIGNSGWWQLIPFYVFWLIFQEGQAGSNQYGNNPKGIQSTSGTTSQRGQSNGTSGSVYQGGYSGGHNNPNSNYSSMENPNKTEGYKDGDLYK